MINSGILIKTKVSNLSRICVSLLLTPPHPPTHQWWCKFPNNQNYKQLIGDILVIIFCIISVLSEFSWSCSSWSVQSSVLQNHGYIFTLWMKQVIFFFLVLCVPYLCFWVIVIKYLYYEKKNATNKEKITNTYS